MRKAIFIGNSFIYYGGCVKCGGEFKNDAASPEFAEKRKDDRGLFYRLCKQNGLDVSVTDATHGGRILAHFTPNGDGEQYPTAGIDLLGSFDLSSYTDVFISEAGRNNADFLQDMKKVMERFTNPDVTFYYLIHNYTIEHRHNNILSALPLLRMNGVRIIPWGCLVYDIIVGDAEINDAECRYNKNSFIVKQNAGDGYHPNPLSGYITAQMCYSAMTGKSAVGTDTSFCADTVDFEAFTDAHYGFENSVTNYPEIISSADMEQIQAHCDKYIERFNN